MTIKLIDTDTCISVVSISTEEDLKCDPRKININPPPANGRCQCCGRQLSELKPFGTAGNPLEFDLDGELLVSSWRRLCPRDENSERLFAKYFGNCRTEEDFEFERKLFDDEYGQGEASNLLMFMNASSLMESVWLCRDCIVLSEEEYYLKVYDGTRKRPNH